MARFALSFCTLLLSLPMFPQAVQSHSPLRVAIVGLVHGHVHGFLSQYQRSPEIEIVGVVELDAQLRTAGSKRYGFNSSQMFADLEEMIAKTHPQAVLVYTNTYDHRRVVEICARHGVHVMMEKPLAVSLEDALWMQKAAQGGNIHVFDTTQAVETEIIKGVGTSPTIAIISQ